MSRLLFLLAGLFFIGCTKEINCHDNGKIVAEEEVTAKGSPKPPSYSSFTIREGQHYCDQNSVKSVRTSEMKFMVKFDSSAIYQTVIPGNQYDINKLWGFTEGINNQYNSARIGWSWNNDALRLYGYVYANGVRHYQEITPVTIGSDITCSIKLSGNTYLFTVNGISVSLPRGPSATQASGYQQYPYFGGDETAPHLITIMIRSL
ncbi:MAG TPA: hypothetical protein VHQ93_04735 [Chitinophagaceae bacterium]|jgi:hypothetical protein|nr:hypothetical protein [Chitinophagaceae bacterium]